MTRSEVQAIIDKTLPLAMARVKAAARQTQQKGNAQLGRVAVQKAAEQVTDQVASPERCSTLINAGSGLLSSPIDGEIAPDVKLVAQMNECPITPTSDEVAAQTAKRGGTTTSVLDVISAARHKSGR
jgi:hypothetical protein